jgi:meckelin
MDSDGSLIDVPVAIRNYAGDDNPNESSDESNWQLTRRFFLFDTVSGIRETNENTGFINRDIAEVVRYPKSITLQVGLDISGDGGKEEKIYSPLLKIYYRERSARYIAENHLTTVSFTAEYSMDTSNFWSTEKAVFVCGAILAFVVLIIKSIVFCFQGNLGDEDKEAQYKYCFIKMIINSIDVFSAIFFWYMFAVTAYWFTFFKWQQNVYLLLPPLNTHSENYYPFDRTVALVASFKLATIAYKIIIEQTSFDIFMIDWERPKCKYIDS